MLVKELIEKLQTFDGESEINFRSIFHLSTFKYLKYIDIFIKNDNSKTICMDFEGYS